MLSQFRSLLTAASIALTACATTSAGPETEALRGCWIERRGAHTLTMRWFPTSGEPSAWTGNMLLYTPGQEPDASVYEIVPAAGEREQWGWAMCPQEEPTNPPCVAAYFGRGDPAAGSWFEIAAAPETLAIRYVTEGGEGFTLFNGQRDGCD